MQFYSIYNIIREPKVKVAQYRHKVWHNTAMPIINAQSKPLRLQLRRNLTRSIKRGHAWVYADALRPIENQGQLSPGTPAILLDNKGNANNAREIARGYYTPNHALAFRACSLQRGEKLDDH